MKWIGACLLVGAFFFNFSFKWTSDGTAYSPYAMWYIHQGFWICGLALMLRWFIAREKPGLARDLALYGATITAFEGFVTGFFRVVVTEPKLVPVGQPLCDYATGLPFQATSIGLYLLVICWRFGKWALSDTNKR